MEPKYNPQAGDTVRIIECHQFGLSNKYLGMTGMVKSVTGNRVTVTLSTTEELIVNDEQLEQKVLAPAPVSTEADKDVDGAPEGEKTTEPSES